ncbi:response regulator [Flavobacterium urocaniciphilum]|uniref:histidine kinase n=1 Tax=Flavobacterium urocaniciphilum TaxID=1299341 RepID=A0A1H9D603_9FLAO|nr:response regulator [Flavobacterium urocaniciphilum]SEQ08809.1 His Kinase A (phospho-acceptor) domain-containing protein [Flavobacterium urocaniciphilum]
MFKKNLVLILILLFSIISYGQGYFVKFKENPKYDSIFKSSLKYLDSENIKDYTYIIKKLKNFENNISGKHKEYNTAAYYLNMSSVYYTQSGLKESELYLEKAYKIITENKFENLLAFYYEMQLVNSSLLSDYERQKKYLASYKKYQEKYTPKEKRSDLYYNLANAYFRIHNWNEAILNAKKYDTIVQILNKGDKNEYIEIIQGISHVNLKHLKEAKKHLANLNESYRLKILDSTASLRNQIMYWNLNGLIAIEENKPDLAKNYFNKSFIKVQILTNNARQKNLKFIRFENQIKLNDYALKVSETKIKANIEKIDYQKKLQFYLIAGLVLLTIVVVLLVLNNRLKAKNNKLLVQSNAELQKTIHIKTKLLDSFSHELRTPLNAIKGVLYLFSKDEKEKNKENLELLENASNQLITLVTNVIDYNVIDSNIKLNNEIVDIKELLALIIKHYEALIKNENSITVTIEPNVSNLIYIDKTRLSQILSCLIDNALKFTSKGEVKINVSVLAIEGNKQVLNFKISDTGIGISKENLATIFELFKQVSDEIHMKYGGSGLGLALVKKNVELLKGNFNIESEENVGTTSEFSIEVEVKNSESLENEITSETNVQKCNSNKILIVEDNKINQILIQKILASKGYETDLAENGKVGVEKALSNDYCLILMDIMMPVMDGFEASKQIKKIKPKVPIIALTAISQELNKSNFMDSEIDQILNKPIKIDQLDMVLKLYCA